MSINSHERGGKFRFWFLEGKNPKQKYIYFQSHTSYQQNTTKRQQKKNKKNIKRNKLRSLSTTLFSDRMPAIGLQRYTSGQTLT